MTSLNPYMRVGEQLMEVLMLHKGMGKAEAFEESVKMLDAGAFAIVVGGAITRPLEIANRFMDAVKNR